MSMRLTICVLIAILPGIIGYSEPAVSGSQGVADTVTITSWTLLIEARIDGLHDSSATLGLRPDATPDFDSQYDRPCPPNPPGNWLQVYFPHTGGNWPTMLGTRFSEDITELDSARWTMNVETTLDTGLVTLSWIESSVNKLPAGYTILMKDEDSGDTIRLRQQPSYTFHYAAPRVFSVWVEYHAAALPLTSGWNLIALPRLATDSSKSGLFPTAISAAFSYEGNYVVKSCLQPGRGYWLKFDGDQTAYVAGATCLTETLSVIAGWNIIGGVSRSVPVGLIASIPPAMVTSSFFGYAGSYFPALSIDPGLGYWVRVRQDCKLILSASGSASPEGRISICPDGERPPEPPGPGMTPDAEVPGGIDLFQNYPNPFNPTTVIQYVIPEQTRVRITLVSLLGEEVALLIDEVEDAGLHSVTLNAGACRLPSGVYFYKFSGTDVLTGKKSDLVKKLILMK